MTYVTIDEYFLQKSNLMVKWFASDLVSVSLAPISTAPFVDICRKHVPISTAVLQRVVRD